LTLGKFAEACQQHISQRQQVQEKSSSKELQLISNPDVVKTRLQVEARQGQTHYKGLTDAFIKICVCSCVMFVMAAHFVD
jgi:hypothetical protein